MPSSARTCLPVLIRTLRLFPASALPAACGGLLLGRRSVGQDRHVLAIVAAMRADHVRPLQLAAILALDMGHRRNGVMRATHVASRLGNLLLGNCHNISRWGGCRRTGACPQKAEPRSISAAGRLL